MAAEPRESIPFEDGFVRLARPLARSDLGQVMTVTRWQLREYWESARFLLMIGLVAVVGGLVTVAVANYHASVITTSTAFYRSLWGTGAVYLAMLGALVFGSDSLAGEFQSRTAYFLLGNPVRRTTVVIGKFLAILLASALILTIFGVVVLLNATYYFGFAGAFPQGLGTALLLTVVFLGAMVATVLLLSAAFRSAMYPAVIGAFLFIMGLPTLDNYLLPLAGVEPWFSLSYAAQVIPNSLANPYPAHTLSMHFWNGATVTAFSPGLIEGSVVMLSYLAITGALTLAIFARREL